MSENEIGGGICAAQGFYAAGVHCGVKAGSDPEKADLALILSRRECTAAAVYTRNRVKAAPILVTKENLRDGRAWGIVANSGNANACCPGSIENARAMCRAAAEATDRAAKDFAVASTGVIGQTLNIDAVRRGVPEAVKKLRRDGSAEAAAAIMTTDTVKKETALSLMLGGREVRMGGIAKGSGMIHPNMGTMLSFLTTDCAISSEMLSAALREAVPRTFNRVTVDGDTSTNDTCAVLANGMAGNPEITEKNEDYRRFADGLTELCRRLARAIAGDGEGAGRLVTCAVSGAEDEETAERLAKAVVGSSLVKAAMFGADANWGRVLCAMGYSGAEFRTDGVDVTFRSPAGEVRVCSRGEGLPFEEELAKKVLSEREITIAVELSEGTGSAECWGCDLTYDYVRINGDYRT